MIHLAEYPICVHCFATGIVEAATEVHHIRPLSKGGSNTSGNLQSLCKPCHSKETRKGVNGG